MGLFLFTNVFCLLTLLIVLLNFINMGKKIILSDEEINEIVKLYLSGISSNNISKNLQLPKLKIVNILKEHNILRSRLLSNEFYSNFWEENGMWFGNWCCENCNEKILFSVNKKYLLNRNIKRKKICKKCSLKKQIGEGNPFFNKKHSEESIKKMLISQNKTIKPISKPEKEIAKILSINKIKFTQQEIIGKPFDFYLPELNLLVEFNGDYWHCNPKIYKHDYFNKKLLKTAKEIWEKDFNKVYLAESRGYFCEVIWESDYKNNKNIILDIIKQYEKK
jgi:G:T-mismatch repair DNA endonuclease (very short patch repair protein)